MTKIATITFEEAVERHSAEVQMIEKYLRRGRSKHRLADISKSEWSYEVAVQVESALLVDVFAREEARAFPPSLPLEVEVAQYVARCSTVLSAKPGGVFTVPNPPEVTTWARKQIEECREEQARVDAMSPEERQHELDEALGQLRGSPGFMEITVRKR